MRALATVLLGLLLFGPARRAVAEDKASDAPKASKMSGAAKAIEAYLSACARFGFSGSVLIVRKGQTVVARGYGMADRKARVPNTPDTLFEIASATKPFTACAVMKLVEQGKLALDDSIAKHLPDVPEDKRAITVRHLLSHRSGMPRSAGGGRGPDLGQAVRGYLRARPARQPGVSFEYWNGGYALLAGIVERASGRSYMDFCQKHLFEPAGLKSAGFTGDTDLPRQAVGYSGKTAVRKAAGHPYGSYGYQYRGMGGIVLSAKELLQFMDALHAGRVLLPASVKLMQTAVTKHYGLGWGIAPTKRQTRRVGHGGDVRGFHMQMQRFPDEDATIIVMCNVEGIPLYTVAWNLEALLFGQKPSYPMPPALVSLDQKTLDGYAGSYVIDKKNRILVERADGGLRVYGDGRKACEVLGAKPVSEGPVKAAIGVIEATRRGDAAPIEKILMAGIPTTWPDHLVTLIWPAHVKRWGAFDGMRVIGARTIGRGRTSVLVELRHARGMPRVKVVLQDGKLNIFDLNGPRYSVSRAVQPVGNGRFTTFSWISWGSARPGVAIRFEKGAILLDRPGGQTARFPIAAAKVPAPPR